MEHWTYQCYVDRPQGNLWTDWYKDNPSAQGAHDAAFDQLEQLEAWREPNAKHSENGDGLIEVQFKAGGVQWRIFGFYRRGVRRCFVVVAIGNHKGRVYQPKTVIGSAKQIMKDMGQGTKSAQDCERP